MLNQTVNAIQGSTYFLFQIPALHAQRTATPVARSPYLDLPSPVFRLFYISYFLFLISPYKSPTLFADQAAYLPVNEQLHEKNDIKFSEYVKKCLILGTYPRIFNNDFKLIDLTNMNVSNLYNRREFLKATAATGIGLSIGGNLFAGDNPKGKRVGIIGLDTSHSIAFTKMLNGPDDNGEFAGYKVVAAYPHGSKDIESSYSRIPGYIKEVEKYGVEVVDSIKKLLRKVDVVLLETNDGRLHLEQALPVLKAGKRMFIDKPVAASLEDAVAIYKAAEQYNIPIFSASSLRYIKGIEKVDRKKVLGADTFSPAKIEKTHPDLFWYGVHGVETLFTVMGTGCKSVVRVHTEDTDVVVGTWEDGRIGTFRGTRTGKHGYGGTVFSEDGTIDLGPYGGYKPLLLDIIKYFETGAVPVTPEETLEIFTFMEAADESKRQGGAVVSLDSVYQRAL